MFGIVLSALRTFLGPLLTALFIKGLVFTALFAVVSLAVSALSASGVLPSISSITAGFGSLPSMTVYMLVLFRFDVAFPSICAAAATRFVIRRIPLIG
jgi:hypothetical protein